jgi:nitroreductase
MVASMETLDAIYGRQSIGKVKPDPLPKIIIEQLLSAAVQAPNHHRVRPWRFIVLEGAARERLGDVMAESKRLAAPDTPAAVLDVERFRPLRAPVIIAVGVDKPAEPKVLEVENLCAAASAAQNLLLAATDLGLGAIWRTGPAALDPRVKQFLGLAHDQHLIGLIYLGSPEGEHLRQERPGFEDRTLWME